MNERRTSHARGAQTGAEAARTAFSNLGTVNPSQIGRVAQGSEFFQGLLKNAPAATRNRIARITRRAEQLQRDLDWALQAIPALRPEVYDRSGGP